MSKMGYVYILTNKNKTTLYIGVTNDLCRRIYEHKNHLIKNSFTDRYNLEYCIYFEEFADFDLAIHREKELKKWNRQKKEYLINKKNPQWEVLVTECGFVRNSSLSFQTALLAPSEAKLSEETHQIPHSVRNDDPQSGGVGGREGGFAALSSSSSPTEIDRHFERSEKTPTEKENTKDSEERN